MPETVTLLATLQASPIGWLFRGLQPIPIQVPVSSSSLLWRPRQLLDRLERLEQEQRPSAGTPGAGQPVLELRQLLHQPTWWEFVWLFEGQSVGDRAAAPVPLSWGVLSCPGKSLPPPDSSKERGWLVDPLQWLLSVLEGWPSTCWVWLLFSQRSPADQVAALDWFWLLEDRGGAIRLGLQGPGARSIKDLGQLEQLRQQYRTHFLLVLGAYALALHSPTLLQPRPGWAGWWWLPLKEEASPGN